ncbi:unnamed protein product [Sphagnum balticum]
MSSSGKGKWVRAATEKTQESIKREPPRKLKPAEIAWFLEGLPRIRSPDRYAAEIAHADNLKLLRAQLSEIEVSPDNDALIKMKRIIIERFYISRVRPGESVGVTPAEAIAGVASQMSLKSVHSAGAAVSASAGITGFQEILYARKNRGNPIVNVFFNDRSLSQSQILDKRIDLVGLTIEDLYRAADNFKIKDLVPIDDPNSDVPLEERYPPRWYQLWKNVYEKEIPSAQQFLELTLDISQLYRHRITTEKIANILELTPGIKCVFSPTALGIIHIYPDLNRARIDQAGQQLAATEEEIADYFLTASVLPILKTTQIKGVTDITDLTPVTVPVLKIVRKEIGVGDNSWYLLLNDIRGSSLGVTRVELRRLLNVIDVEITNEDRFGVHIRYRLGDAGKKSPIELIKAQLADEAKKMKDANKKRITLPPSAMPITSAGQIFYAQCTGSNFMGLMLRPDVDTSTTNTNNIHDTARILGIEAAYNLICQELNDATQNVGSYVNSRHIMLTATSMCSTGFPTGNNFQGYIKKNPGTLALATLERAPAALISGARVGKTEGMNVSAALALGNLIPLGTGSVSIEINQTMLDRYEREMKKRPLDSAVEVTERTLEDLENGIDEIADQHEALYKINGFGQQQKFFLQGQQNSEDHGKIDIPAGPFSGPAGISAPSSTIPQNERKVAAPSLKDFKHPTTTASGSTLTAISQGLSSVAQTEPSRANAAHASIVINPVLLAKNVDPFADED